MKWWIETWDLIDIETDNDKERKKDGDRFLKYINEGTALRNKVNHICADYWISFPLETLKNHNAS